MTYTSSGGFAFSYVLLPVTYCPSFHLTVFPKDTTKTMKYFSKTGGFSLQARSCLHIFATSQHQSLLSASEIPERYNAVADI